jgi:hypothetical protein
VSDPNHQGNLRCRQCDNSRDQGLSYGDHSTQCHGGGSIHRCHNRLKNILYHTLKAAGYSFEMETAHHIPGSLIRPGDVTVVSPVVESSLSSSARSVGFAADTVERRNAVHYANNCACQGIHYIPLAQETLGGCSTQAGKMLWHKKGRAGLALQVHSVRTSRPLAKVDFSSSLPSFFRSPPVLAARQVDREPIMGCLVLFPIERERPQFNSLNFGPSGLESLPATRRPRRHCRYGVIINRNANSK